MSKIQVLLMSFDKDLQEQYFGGFKDVDIHCCSDKSGMKELMLTKGMNFQMVVCGPGMVGLTSSEVAQTVRMLYPQAMLCHVFYSTEGFDRGVLLKNGFNEVFLLPMDHVMFKATLEKTLASAEEQLYTSVRLVDMGAGTQLEFELRVFLSRNNKFIPYVIAGDVLDETRLERLKTYRVTEVFVPIDQLDKFYSYSAKRLIDLGKPSGTTSETKRQEMLKNSVRELLSGMLSESYSKNLKSGRKVIEHTKRIVEEMLDINHPGDWRSRLISQIGAQGDAYSHASSVSSYAVLFALALGMGNTQELAIAAMFHDLGKTDLPAKIQALRYEQMSADEKMIFHTHPELSVKVIQARQIAISDVVMKSILQHHEKWNGGGFPRGLAGHKILVEAQILALANRFDELTRVEVNQTPLSPDQAIKKIASEGLVDPEIVSHVQKMFDSPK